MADEKPDVKSLEMRIAALEDKLSKLNISEEDMRTYQRVASALGTGGGAEQVAGPAMPAPDACTVCQILRQRLVCIIPRQRIRFCVECNECGPCGWGGGGFSGGGGFGGFGG